MDMTVEELAGGVTKVALNGRLDIEGAQAVDTRFNVIAGSKKKIVIDLSDLSFVASMGLRTLMMCARTVKLKGGKMAIANAQPNVLKVLSSSGIGEVVSVNPSLETAIAAVSA